MEYRRSTYCGNSSCVEVGYQPAQECGTTTCVEVNRDYAHHDLILVRDSKEPDQLSLRFTLDEWRAFTDGVRNGEFDV